MAWSLRYHQGGNRADYDDRVRLGVDKRSMRRLLPKGSWSQIRWGKGLSLRLSPVPLGAFTAWREDSSTSQARFDRHQLRCIILQIGCDGRSGTTSPVANSTPGPRGGGGHWETTSKRAGRTEPHQAALVVDPVRQTLLLTLRVQPFEPFSYSGPATRG